MENSISLHIISKDDKEILHLVFRSSNNFISPEIWFITSLSHPFEFRNAYFENVIQLHFNKYEIKPVYFSNLFKTELFQHASGLISFTPPYQLLVIDSESCLKNLCRWRCNRYPFQPSSENRSGVIPLYFMHSLNLIWN